MELGSEGPGKPSPEAPPSLWSLLFSGLSAPSVWWALPYLQFRFLKPQLSAPLPLQVDPAYTGRVGASEAALFLKKSGLSDIILGKVGTSRPWVISAAALGVPLAGEGCPVQTPPPEDGPSGEWAGHCQPLRALIGGPTYSDGCYHPLLG